MEKKIRVGLIMGGKSDEFEVSIMSSVSVMKHLDSEHFELIPIGISRAGHWIDLQDAHAKLGDELKSETVLKECITQATAQSTGAALQTLMTGTDVLFPVLHGPFGEDGTIQGLFEMLDKPYVGARVAASALCMDKGHTKRILRDAGIPVTPWVEMQDAEFFRQPEPFLNRVSGELGFPVFVKPANLGSSVGISKVKRAEELDAAVRKAFQYDSKILVEQGIDCRELECAVLGNKTPEASCVGEILPAHEFYDYEAKYFCDGESRLIIPAEIDGACSDRIRQIAVEAFRLLGISGLSRIDFFLNRANNQVILNEINTMPGFTKYSMYPQLWAESGVGYQELITRLIRFALEERRCS